ncbi:MAG: hypothetical protein HYV32_04005 [Candidatus Kerfeldbacteria bacterium]|nr:hypothetical protein [Candidatus Kerfeldbacteria bacterium]
MSNTTPRRASKFIVGAGIAAAVAAGVLTFITNTKRGKAIAKKGREHAADLANEVAKRAEKIRSLTQQRYEGMIDDIVAEYQKRKKLTTETAQDLAKQLKKEWNHIKKELKK